MSSFLDLSQDYLMWTNTELSGCRYQSTRNTGTMVDSIAICKKRSASDKEQAASGGAYTGTDVLWLIPTQQLAKSIGEPKPGDVVIDRDGNEFTVLQATGKRRDANGYQQWNLMSRNLVVAYDLRDTITIQTATATTDPNSGADLLSWQPIYQALPCKVQEVAAEESEERGIRGTARKYEIFVATDLAGLDTNCRVVWPAALGGYLEVKGYRGRGRIDELSVIEALLSP